MECIVACPCHCYLKRCGRWGTNCSRAARISFGPMAPGFRAVGSLLAEGSATLGGASKSYLGSPVGLHPTRLVEYQMIVLYLAGDQGVGPGRPIASLAS